MNQPNGPVYHVGPQPVEAKKPWVHGLLSGIIPGLGSMMAGDAAVGALLLLGLWVVYPIAFWVVLLSVGLGEASAGGSGVATAWTWVGLILVGVGMYVFGIVRAFLVADRWNNVRGLR